MGHESEFDWARRYLEENGYRIRENLATATLSVLRLDEHGEIADDAVLKEDGEVLLTYEVKSPLGIKKVLKPGQIVVLAQSVKQANEEK